MRYCSGLVTRLVKTPQIESLGPQENTLTFNRAHPGAESELALLVGASTRSIVVTTGAGTQLSAAANLNYKANVIVSYGENSRE